ncbi:MAG: fibronectin type III domain-containing protein, partial [Bacillota bacterium]|nr:fibronectin type III domain-containing protein [Bacillota bacterium]
KGKKLTVGGNFTQSYSLYVDGGQLTVEGNYTISSGTSGYLQMTNPADYILIKGNFFTQAHYSHEGYLTAGTIEVRGDFTQKYYDSCAGGKSFKATGTHKVILNGSGLQNVSFDSPESGFSTLELTNNSGQEVKFLTPLNALKLVTNGCKVSFSNGDVMGWKLEKDETYDGDLYLAGDTLDLNGHELTVKGNLIQSGGVVYVNGGKLTVTGDYRLQSAVKDANGNVTYSYSNGYLKMTNDEDYVKVGGSFVTQSQFSHNGMLTAGVMEVKGDFIQKRQNAYDNFNAGGTHKVLLSGATLQTIYFDNASSSYSCMGTLEITNSSAAGVKFGTKTVVSKEVKSTATPLVDSKNLYLGLGAEINWDTWPYDIGFEENRTLKKDLNVQGDLYINGGTFNQNNFKINVGKSFYLGIGLNLSNDINVGKDMTISNVLDLKGKKLTVGGNLTQSYSLIVDGGQVIVEGNYTIPNGTSGYLQMTNEADYVLIKGNFFTQAHYSHEGYLTAGVMEVKGDFTQKYYDSCAGGKSFKATGTHKVVLSGSGIQNVYFDNPESSMFNVLSITKQLNIGYTFNKTPVWNKLLEEQNDTLSPSDITDLAASSKTETKVSLTWSPSQDNVGVAGYYIYRNGNLVGSAVKTNFLDTGLTPDKTYTYKVIAFDIVRNMSNDSNFVEVTTDLDILAPSSPKNLVISSKTSSSVNLSWTGSTDNVKVAEYKIFRNGEEIGRTDGISFSDKELAAGAYRYTVKAYDDAGNISDASNELVFDNMAPKAPQLTVDSVTITSASLSWNIPEDNIGVTQYSVYRNGTLIRNLTATKYTDTGLTPDTTYEYYVTAADGSGNISESSSIKTIYTIVDTEKPSIPVNLYLSARTGHTVSFAWTPSTDNVSVKGYEIYRDGALVGTATSNNYTDTGLTPNTTYKYSVSAYDNAGNKSDQSQQISATPLLPNITKVTPSDGVNIGGVGNELTLYFTNSDNYAGAHATFEYSTDGSNWSNIKSVNSPSANSSEAWFSCYWDLTGIGVSGNYMVRFTVFDAANDSDSMTVTYGVDRSAPSKPVNLTATASEGIINLKWDPCHETDTKAYRIYRASEINGNWIQIGSVMGQNNVYYSDKGLEIGKTYYYKVSGVDNLGLEGNASEVISATAQAETTPPVILGIEPSNNTTMGSSSSIVVRAQDNVKLFSIKLQYSLTGLDNWTDIQTINTTGNATFGWNTPNINGNVYVRAIAKDTSGNESDGTPVRTYIIDRQGPQKVAGLKAIPASDNITLNWDDVPDNDFSYFQVECQKADGSFASVGTVSTQRGIQFFGLQNNTTYVYRVCAYDRYGNRGEESDIISVTTTDDTTKPVITYLGPASNRYSGQILLEANIYDNVKVANAVLQMSRDKV